MKSETYTFTPDYIGNINGRVIHGKSGYMQGFRDDRGSFIALLIPCDKSELDELKNRVIGVY